MYDSTEDTQQHIAQVQGKILEVVKELTERARLHDTSKLVAPEKEIYDAVTPKLWGMTFGSDEYMQTLKEMGSALEHHYSVCRHHPEHWPHKLWDMSLIDLIEMLADWKAATLRHEDGNLRRSIMFQIQRFGITPQVAHILLNTALDLGWIDPLADDHEETTEEVRLRIAKSLNDAWDEDA